jgi:hypothetical protein
MENEEEAKVKEDVLTGRLTVREGGGERTL